LLDCTSGQHKGQPLGYACIGPTSMVCLWRLWQWDPVVSKSCWSERTCS